jgi:hypothetical protein
MTSTNQTSSGAVANLVSSSPELLTRPASKPDDRTNPSAGELCTSSLSRRRADESHFLSARTNRKHPHHFLTANRTDLRFTTLQIIRRSGCSACSAYPYEKIRIQPLAVSLQTSLPPAETIAEILLRFAETSQQTLRHFSLLPTTYINFDDKKPQK